MKPCQGLDTAPKIHPHNWQELACALPVHAERWALNWVWEVKSVFATWDAIVPIPTRAAGAQVPRHMGSQRDQKPQPRTFKSGDAETGFTLRRPKDFACVGINTIFHCLNTNVCRQWEGFPCLWQAISEAWHSNYSMSPHKLPYTQGEDEGTGRPKTLSEAKLPWEEMVFGLHW